MIYDALPINDIFRKVDDDTVLGVMDLRFTPHVRRFTGLGSRREGQQCLVLLLAQLAFKRKSRPCACHIGSRPSAPSYCNLSS